MKFSIRLAACCAGLIPGAVALGQETFKPDPARSSIRSPLVTEASGMAVSRRDSARIWIINDSGAPARLHLLGSDGADYGHVTLENATNTDWEDLASFTLDGKHWLLVADAGDNNAKRDGVTLWLLEEPALPQNGGMLAGEAAAARRIVFRYQGGPRDCEAVAVDAVERTILLLTKRTLPPELHSLPLDPPAGSDILTTRRIATVRTPAPTSSLLPYADQPTAMDIAADRSLAAVLTYYGVFVFPRKPGQSWSEALEAKPVLLPPHRTPQAESLAFSADGRTLFVASEGRHAPLVRYRRAAMP